MVRSILTYALALGVVFFGFQHNAFADEKDKDDKKKTSTTSISKIDTTSIKKIEDITVGDTLVFDDFDEDEDDEESGESGSIALVTNHGANSQVKTEVVVLRTHCTVTMQRRDIQNLPALGSSEVSSTEEAQAETASTYVSVTEPFEANVYPNPAQSGMSPVHVSHNFDGQAQLTIYAMGGQLVQQITTTQKITDIDGLTQGMYIVHIAANSEVVTKKLLVQ